MSAYQKRVYMLAMAFLLLSSVYPILMGIAVLRDLISLGAVSAENYPKYVIPYTPICISLLLTAALIPLADKLKKCDVEYVHPIVEHSWGQRVVRFYDPDKHIIEVGENMKIVCKRFLNSGMTPEQVAERMDVPMKFVNACMR